MIEEDDDERNVCDKSWGYFAKKKSVSDRNGAKVELGELDDKTIQFPLLDSVGNEDAKSECLCPS